MAEGNWSVIRVEKITAESAQKNERHNERKNESYANLNVDTKRIVFNVHFKDTDGLTYYLFKLSEQGELYRRWQGQTHGPILTEQFFRVHLAPREVAAAKDAILTAIVLGFRREEKEAGDLDLGLVELQKKTGSP